MLNRITLIGIVKEHSEAMYDPDGHKFMTLWLTVPPPSDAPPTYWGMHYDIRNPDWPTGEGAFIIVIREPALVEKCLQLLHQGALVCIEGRLVLTGMRVDGVILPLAEILASGVTSLA